MKTIAHLRNHWREAALRRGITPRDVDLLLSDVTGRSLAWVFAHGDELLDEAEFESLLARRFNGEPLQYIRKRTEFYGRDFYVDDRVLIPRPETEILVEAAIARVPRGARVIDVGAGSGCISITLALERPDLHVHAVDASVAALAVAKRNRDALGARVQLVASDVFEAVRGFDFVVANPPYIAEEEIATLATEVRDHEPRMALTPGPCGTEVIERIYAGAGGAPVMMEIAYGQTEAVRRVAEAHSYRVDEVLRDLAGIERVVVSSRHG
ncbi:MAG TPA: peptide chain release factor N(5)-glutamine methyltransferase [Thermoanaerobaculia bacterium]|nr:peptide chain release factor N(5)-glutamine methyltransferase [Thermoanaerobaculia bacterium]